MSYSGRSARDNSARPPSVLLAELLDTLVPALCAPGASAAEQARVRAGLVHAHPLQPFDESYFLPGASPAAAQPPGAGTLSYRSALAAALRQRSAAQWRAPDALAAVDPLADEGEMHDDEEGDDEAYLPPFFALPLPDPGPEWRVLSLDQLIRFLHNPARVLLRDRLGLTLPGYVVEWNDSEDFLPEWRAATQFGTRLLPALLDELAPLQVSALAAAGLEYPEGPLGDAARALELERLRGFVKTLRLQQSGTPLATHVGALDLRLDGETWTLQGAADGLFAAADGHAVQSQGRYQDLGVRLELEAWVRHLWLAALAPGDLKWSTRWLLRDGVLHYRPVAAEQARACLVTLLGLYRRGLCLPLHFFPKSSRRFHETGRLADARKVWASTDYQPRGEDRDPAYRLALRAAGDPLDEQFEVCARLVFDPLMAALDPGATS